MVSQWSMPEPPLPPAGYVSPEEQEILAFDKAIDEALK